MAKAAQKLVGLGTRLGTSLVTQGPKVAGGVHISPYLCQTRAFGSEAVQWSRPRLSKFWYYARVELTPPMPSDMPAISNGFSKIVASARTGKFMNLTVKEAWLNTLVCAEVVFWFFIGEQIGRRSFIGYNIKSDYEPHGYI